MAAKAEDIMQQKLVESIEEVQKWANSGIDFVAEQTPLLIQEMIR